MTIPTKKLDSGFEIPVFALGTWEMGGKIERIENYDPEKDIKAIQKAYELGVTRFDTAEKYAAGLSEEILGKALKEYDRSKLFVTTKVPRQKLKYDDVIKSAEESLKRLDMDYLDLYLIQSPSSEIPLEETMKAFDKLKEDGTIKNIGVSNFSVETLKRAQDASSNKIVLNQVHYNLIFREPAFAGLLEHCQSNDIFMEAWRPIQQGNLARPGIVMLDQMAEKYGKTQVQIALNWLVSQENVVTLSKASNIGHLEDNLGALDWEMESSDVEKLIKEFPIQLDRSNAVQLG